jgi:UDP-2,3-diacylglucosamine hydrolase
MEAPVAVVADVHLSAREPDVAARFAAFLATREGRGGSLVLLGDLFDWWVGDAQARRPFEAAVIARLARVAASGVRLAFVAGNRDFAFEGAPGLAIERWPDAAKARWGNRTVLLTHGDLLCTADAGYLALRSVLRSPPFAWGRRALPFRVTSYVAEGLRGVSMRSGRRSPGAVRGIDYGAAAAWMEAEDADVLVAGHVHTGVHHVLTGPRRREVYVLKDWDRRPNAVLFDGDRIALTAV